MHLGANQQNQSIGSPAASTVCFRPCNTASVVPPAASPLPAPENPSTQNAMRVRRRLLHSGNNPAKFTLGSDVFKLKALPLMGSAVDYSKRGVGAFCQWVGFVPIGGGALGSRLQRWRCSLSFRADTSTSNSWQAVPSSQARRHPRRSRPNKIQISIRRTRRAIFARSARPYILPRHHSCRMRRACRFRSRP